MANKELICKLEKFNADNSLEVSSALIDFSSLTKYKNAGWLTDEEFKAIKRAFFKLEEAR